MTGSPAGSALRRTHMFVDAESLGRAGNTLRSDRAHPSLLALRRSTDLFLEMALADAPRRATSSNLFVIQNGLLELSLVAGLGEEDRHIDALSVLIAALDDSGISSEHLPEELHSSFVLIGLAVALDLAGHLLTEETLITGRAAIETLAERLDGESLIKEWGQPVKRRAAWNHSIVSYAGIGTAGLALPDHPSAAHWVALATERALLFFEHGVTAAGMTREGLAYCGFVFRNLGLFLRGAKATGAFDYLDPAQNPYLERLARVPEWYAGEIFPYGGWMQNLNDSYWDPNYALIGWLTTFMAIRPALVSAVWQRTLGEDGRATFGLDPTLTASSAFESALWHPEAAVKADEEPSFYHCPDVGYVREWLAGSRTGFSFNCGEYIGSIHDHSDNNAFTLFAHGVPIALDAGAFDYPQEGNASSSFGHNAVVIDGRGQLPAGHGYGASGQIVYLDRDESRLIVAGDARRSFISLDYNPVRRATRWCVFVKRPDPYLLVYDDIEKDEVEHNYEFLLHAPAPRAARIDHGVVRMDLEFEGHRATCDVAVLEPGTIALGRETFVCPGHPPFEQHALWRMARRAVNPEFIVLFVPGRQAGPPGYRADVERAASSLTITIQFAAGGIDRVVLPRGGVTGSTKPHFRSRRTPWWRARTRRAV